MMQFLKSYECCDISAVTKTRSACVTNPADDAAIASAVTKSG